MLGFVGLILTNLSITNIAALMRPTSYRSKLAEYSLALSVCGSCTGIPLRATERLCERRSLAGQYQPTGDSDMTNRMTGQNAPIKLMWNNSMGEGWLLIDAEFNDLHDVTKLDMLKDFIHALKEEYQEQLDLAFGDCDDD